MSGPRAGPSYCKPSRQKRLWPSLWGLILLALMLPLTGLAEVRAKAVALGSYASLVMTEDGQVISFKEPSVMKNPVRIHNVENAVGIAETDDFGLALLANGKVLSWKRTCQALDEYPYDCIFSTAQEVEGLDRIIAIAAGRGFALALQEDGTLWGWGKDSLGEITGNSSVKGKRIIEQPTRIPLPGPVATMAAGYAQSIAYLKDGRMISWGAPSSIMYIGRERKNNNGFVWREVDGIPKVKQIAFSDMAHFLDDEGKVWSLGVTKLNHYYVEMYGYGTPTITGDGKTFQLIGSASHVVYGVDESGSVFAWGWFEGSFHNSTKEPVIKKKPEQIKTLPSASYISSSTHRAAIVGKDGSVWLWDEMQDSPPAKVDINLD